MNNTESMEREWRFYLTQLALLVEKMRVRFRQKLEDGWGGWTDPAYRENIRARMEAKAKNPGKKDLVDIANFALFLFTMPKEGR